jgi:cytochrome b subunit of formate dehydrogenase
LEHVRLNFFAARHDPLFAYDFQTIRTAGACLLLGCCAIVITAIAGAILFAIACCFSQPVRTCAIAAFTRAVLGAACLALIIVVAYMVTARTGAVYRTTVSVFVRVALNTTGANAITAVGPA